MYAANESQTIKGWIDEGVARHTLANVVEVIGICIAVVPIWTE